MVLNVGLIVVGVVLIAGSRTIAYGFEIPGDRSPVTRFVGFGDDVVSRYRRWWTAVVLGLACIGIGVARLFS
jgi:hypothetical protein